MRSSANRYLSREVPALSFTPPHGEVGVVPAARMGKQRRRLHWHICRT